MAGSKSPLGNMRTPTCVQPITPNLAKHQVPVPKGLDLDKWIDPAAEQGLGMDDDEPESAGEVLWW